MAKIKKQLQTRTGMTLLEMTISISIMAIVMSAVLPQFHNVFSSWESRRNTAELIQNGRVLHEHVNRLLREAVKITEMSSPDSNAGYIEFETSAGEEYRYELAENGYVRYGLNGSMHDLAGPVDSFNIKCYEKSISTTPLTDPDLVRFIKVESRFDNARQNARGRNFKSCISLNADNNPNDSLIHHWSFDDPTGKKLSDSVGSLHGHAGNQVTMGQPSARNDLDSSINLNGDIEKSKVDLRKANDLRKLTKNFTISAWVRPEPMGEKAVIIGPSENLHGWSLSLSDGWLVFTVMPEEEHWADANVPLYQWSHVAMVFDGACNISFYLNGELTASAAADGPAATIGGNKDWTIGQANEQNPFKGNLDDIKIFDTALNPQQVAFVYKLANPVAPNGNNGNGNGSNNGNGNDKSNNGNNNPPEPNENSGSGNNNGNDNNNGKANGKNKK
ncbi:LamG-like jellyroll fold domain-containing protein [Anaerohalosphaera lusitana]|nr:LamG-like jellyroll fold domain-containing protein [Anaerohalosphaera lusitana]